jgi:hypothetical protein
LPELVYSEQNGGMRRRIWIAVLAVSAWLGAFASPTGLVDLNRASVAELMQVPGMTVTWAARIVRFRPYRTKMDLVEGGVVTPEVYRRIRDGVVAHRVGPETGHR